MLLGVSSVNPTQQQPLLSSCLGFPLISSKELSEEKIQRHVGKKKKKFIFESR